MNNATRQLFTDYVLINLDVTLAARQHLAPTSLAFIISNRAAPDPFPLEELVESGFCLASTLLDNDSGRDLIDVLFELATGSADAQEIFWEAWARWAQKGYVPIPAGPLLRAHMDGEQLVELVTRAVNEAASEPLDTRWFDTLSGLFITGCVDDGGIVVIAETLGAAFDRMPFAADERVSGFVFDFYSMCQNIPFKTLEEEFDPKLELEFYAKVWSQTVAKFREATDEHFYSAALTALARLKMSFPTENYRIDSMFVFDEDLGGSNAELFDTLLYSMDVLNGSLDSEGDIAPVLPFLKNWLGPSMETHLASHMNDCFESLFAFCARVCRTACALLDSNAGRATLRSGTSLDADLASEDDATQLENIDWQVEGIDQRSVGTNRQSENSLKASLAHEIDSNLKELIIEIVLIITHTGQCRWTPSLAWEEPFRKSVMEALGLFASRCSLDISMKTLMSTVVSLFRDDLQAVELFIGALLKGLREDPRDKRPESEFIFLATELNLELPESWHEAFTFSLVELGLAKYLTFPSEIWLIVVKLFSGKCISYTHVLRLISDYKLRTGAPMPFDNIMFWHLFSYLISNSPIGVLKNIDSGDQTEISSYIRDGSLAAFEYLRGQWPDFVVYLRKLLGSKAPESSANEPNRMCLMTGLISVVMAHPQLSFKINESASRLSLGQKLPSAADFVQMTFECLESGIHPQDASRFWVSILAYHMSIPSFNSNLGFGDAIEHACAFFPVLFILRTNVITVLHENMEAFKNSRLFYFGISVDSICLDWVTSSKDRLLFIRALFPHLREKSTDPGCYLKSDIFNGLADCERVLLIHKFIELMFVDNRIYWDGFGYLALWIREDFLTVKHLNNLLKYRNRLESPDVYTHDCPAPKPLASFVDAMLRSETLNDCVVDVLKMLVNKKALPELASPLLEILRVHRALPCVQQMISELPDPLSRQIQIELDTPRRFLQQSDIKSSFSSIDDCIAYYRTLIVDLSLGRHKELGEAKQILLKVVMDMTELIEQAGYNQESRFMRNHRQALTAIDEFVQFSLQVIVLIIRSHSHFPESSALQLPSNGLYFIVMAISRFVQSKLVQERCTSALLHMCTDNVTWGFMLTAIKDFTSVEYFPFNVASFNRMTLAYWKGESFEKYVMMIANAMLTKSPHNSDILLSRRYYSRDGISDRFFEGISFLIDRGRISDNLCISLLVIILKNASLLDLSSGTWRKCLETMAKKPCQGSAASFRMNVSKFIIKILLARLTDVVIDVYSKGLANRSFCHQDWNTFFDEIDATELSKGRASNVLFDLFVLRSTGNSTASAFTLLQQDFSLLPPSVHPHLARHLLYYLKTSASFSKVLTLLPKDFYADPYWMMVAQALVEEPMSELALILANQDQMVMLLDVVMHTLSREKTRRALVELLSALMKWDDKQPCEWLLEMLMESHSCLLRECFKTHEQLASLSAELSDKYTHLRPKLFAICFPPNELDSGIEDSFKEQLVKFDEQACYASRITVCEEVQDTLVAVFNANRLDLAGQYLDLFLKWFLRDVSILSSCEDTKLRVTLHLNLLCENYHGMILVHFGRYRIYSLILSLYVLMPARPVHWEIYFSSFVDLMRESLIAALWSGTFMKEMRAYCLLTHNMFENEPVDVNAGRVEQLVDHLAKIDGEIDPYYFELIFTHGQGTSENVLFQAWTIYSTRTGRLDRKVMSALNKHVAENVRLALRILANAYEMGLLLGGGMEEVLSGFKAALVEVFSRGLHASINETRGWEIELQEWTTKNIVDVCNERRKKCEAEALNEFLRLTADFPAESVWMPLFRKLKMTHRMSTLLFDESSQELASRAAALYNPSVARIVNRGKRAWLESYEVLEAVLFTITTVEKSGSTNYQVFFSGFRRFGAPGSISCRSEPFIIVQYYVSECEQGLQHPISVQDCLDFLAYVTHFIVDKMTCQRFLFRFLATLSPTLGSEFLCHVIPLEQVFPPLKAAIINVFCRLISMPEAIDELAALFHVSMRHNILPRSMQMVIRSVLDGNEREECVWSV